MVEEIIMVQKQEVVDFTVQTQLPQEKRILVFFKGVLTNLDGHLQKAVQVAVATDPEDQDMVNNFHS